MISVTLYKIYYFDLARIFVRWVVFCPSVLKLHTKSFSLLVQYLGKFRKHYVFHIKRILTRYIRRKYNYHPLPQVVIVSLRYTCHEKSLIISYKSILAQILRVHLKLCLLKLHIFEDFLLPYGADDSKF